jgi:hypothetical protein
MQEINALDANQISNKKKINIFFYLLEWNILNDFQILTSHVVIGQHIADRHIFLH